MNTERRETPSPVIELRRLFDLEDLVFLREATIGLPETSVTVLKKAGENYLTTALLYHNGEKHFALEKTEVPKGQVYLSIKTDSHNFSFIWREVENLKEAKEEKDKAG